MGFIKSDVMQVVLFFFQQYDKHFKQLNSGHMVLLPKKKDVLCLGDYIPISLTHSVAKIFSQAAS
jgi:hypothetical protein